MGNLKSFKSFYEETVRPIVITYGRFNPPTIGHEKLLDAVASVAGKNPYRIYASQSQDDKKNPLPYEEKVKFLRKMFPRYARNIILDETVKTFLGVAFVLNREGFNHLTVVVGSDRVDDLRDLLIKYNGGRYNFEKIEVVSAGVRDPDGDEVSAMSASKLRAAAADGDLSTFSKGMPKGFGEVQDLFNAVRKGMGLTEMTQFRKHIELPSISEIRDLYVKGEIFQEGTKVLHNNAVYTIKERKTNFVVCISESGKTEKFWLDKIVPFTEGKKGLDGACWDGYKAIGTKEKNGKRVPNCVPEENESSLEESYDGDSFFEQYGVLELDLSSIQEAEYQGRKVELNKPMQGDVKKFKVYVKNKEGKVVKINFGDPNMTIKKHIPARRKSFRARHKCDTDPADRDTARYWSCKKW